MADDLKPPVSLYETDFVAWTEAQAEALRRVRPLGLDWSLVAEEIEDLGKSDQRACESLLEQIVLHLLKIELGVDRASERHWRGEVRAFRRSLSRRLSPTIEGRIRPMLAALVDRALGDLIEDGLVKPVTRIPSGYDWSVLTTEGRFSALLEHSPAKWTPVRGKECEKAES
ncbi:DUF29 domain-containing protein [Brevundimonas aurifodinae]|uniref:DUF29 domain-containing protein n=2 Tax=Brevundimonas TaxID=41275 RepID=A0ABV1NJD7_9CAUL|nr:MAG: hypothetical protein B7Z42_03160 [Brevundimonas sp. 12-68-7]OYX34756.1 MAG: hypothetical protein B7Z01_04220 [Brevundimonas subvibrioides]